jgi:hypothetical protein
MMRGKCASRICDKILNVKQTINFRMMIPKIIGAVFGILAVGIYAWKFMETPLCRPEIMFPFGIGAG